jgi:hypothetical protein
LNRLGQLEILQKLLEASGHEIVGTAYNGLEATQLIQTELSENRRGGQMLHQRGKNQSAPLNPAETCEASRIETMFRIPI